MKTTSSHLTATGTPHRTDSARTIKGAHQQRRRCPRTGRHLSGWQPNQLPTPSRRKKKRRRHTSSWLTSTVLAS